MNRCRRRHVAACGLATCALLLAAIGCSPTEKAQTESAAQNLVQLALADRVEFDAVLARLADKVVLIDCWATWCLPCVEQLPHTVELAKKHGSNGLAVVTLSFDDSNMSDRAAKVLVEAGAGTNGVTNLQSRFGASPESMDAFAISSGALPAYKLYDRKGTLRRTFELDPTENQQFTPQDVAVAVNELLTE